MENKVQYLGSFYRKDNKIFFMNSQMKWDVAACSPEDTFDEFEGCRIALCRAYNRPDKTETFLEGDFLCTIPNRPNGSCYSLTDGKIYHFEKGNAKADNNARICELPAKSLKDLNDKFGGGNTIIRFYKVN